MSTNNRAAGAREIFALQANSRWRSRSSTRSSHQCYPKRAQVLPNTSAVHPVTELNCESEPGQGVDAAQAAQPVGHGRELGIGRHGADLLIEPVTPGKTERGRIEGRVEGRQRSGAKGCEFVLPDAPQPCLMGGAPAGTAVIDEVMAQQELREPMPAHHQFNSGVLARPDEVSGGFFDDRRHADSHELIDFEQSYQQEGIAGVGFDLVSGRGAGASTGRRRSPGSSGPRGCGPG